MKLGAPRRFAGQRCKNGAQQRGVAWLLRRSIVVKNWGAARRLRRRWLRKNGAQQRRVAATIAAKMGAQRCDDCARRGNGAHSCATLARRVCAKWAHSAAMILCGAEMARSTNSSWHRRRQWGARTWHAAAGACWCTKVTVMVMVTVRRVGLWAQPVRNAFLVALCESGRTLCLSWEQCASGARRLASTGSAATWARGV